MNLYILCGGILLGIASFVWQERRGGGLGFQVLLATTICVLVMSAWPPPNTLYTVFGVIGTISIVLGLFFNAHRVNRMQPQCDKEIFTGLEVATVLGLGVILIFITCWGKEANQVLLTVGLVGVLLARLYWPRKTHQMDREPLPMLIGMALVTLISSVLALAAFWGWTAAVFTLASLVVGLVLALRARIQAAHQPKAFS